MGFRQFLHATVAITILYSHTAAASAEGQPVTSAIHTEEGTIIQNRISAAVTSGRWSEVQALLRAHANSESPLRHYARMAIHDATTDQNRIKILEGLINAGQSFDEFPLQEIAFDVADTENPSALSGLYDRIPASAKATFARIMVENGIKISNLTLVSEFKERLSARDRVALLVRNGQCDVEAAYALRLAGDELKQSDPRTGHSLFVTAKNAEASHESAKINAEFQSRRAERELDRANPIWQQTLERQRAAERPEMRRRLSPLIYPNARELTNEQLDTMIEEREIEYLQRTGQNTALRPGPGSRLTVEARRQWLLARDEARRHNARGDRCELMANVISRPLEWLRSEEGATEIARRAGRNPRLVPSIRTLHFAAVGEAAEGEPRAVDSNTRSTGSVD